MSIKQAIEALEQLVISVQNATPDEGCEQSIAHARGMGEAAIQSLRSIPDAKPVAWAIFTDAGNARMWTTFQPHVQKLADAEGLTVTPLYADPAALAALRSMPEPVAIRTKWPKIGGGWTWVYTDGPNSFSEFEFEPLFATPHAAPLSDAEERAAFEAWYLNGGADTLLVEKDTGGNYYSRDTDIAWTAWQARAIERAVLRGGEK